METVTDFIFLGFQITAGGDCTHEIKRCLLLGRKAMTNLDSILKSRDITLPTKVRLVKAMVFPVVMYGCESWTIKKAECRRIDAFELWCWRKLLRLPWTARRSNQSILKETSPEWFIGRTQAEAETETPVLWPPDAKNWLIGKDPDAGKDWRQEEKGMTEDEMVGGHHWLNQHEFELALGVGEGQGSLACCSPRGHKQSDLTEQLNWTELIFIVFLLCASLVVQSVKNLPAGDLGSIPGSRRSPWRKKWQPTPVFLPGAFNGQRSLQSLGSHRVRLHWATNTFTVPGTKFCYYFPSYRGGRRGPKRIST